MTIQISVSCLYLHVSMLNLFKSGVPRQNKRRGRAIIISLVAVILLAGVAVLLYTRLNSEGSGKFKREAATFKTPDQNNQSRIAEKDRLISDATTATAKRDAYISKGLLLSTQRDDMAAIKAYKAAEQLDSSDVQAPLALCNIYFFAKKQTETKTYCRRVADIVSRDKNSPYFANRDLYSKMANAASSGAYADAPELKDVQP